MTEAVTLVSVISIISDQKPEQTPENDYRRLLRNAVSAAIESGAEVLVCPASPLSPLADNSVSTGTLMGEVLKEPEFRGTLDEVVIVGNRIFAQAAACAVRGEAMPEVPAERQQSMASCGTESFQEECLSRATSRKNWGKTPRHNSSEFLTKHYTEVREIGKGAFGKVTLVRENA